MCKITAKQWKKFLVWISAYVNVIVFALVGAYFMLKEEDEDVKRTVKYAFITYVAFVACSAVLNMYSYLGNAFDWDYNSWVYDVYAALVLLNNIARIVVFAVFSCIALFKKEDCCRCDSSAEDVLDEKKEEDAAVEESTQEESQE